MKMFPIIALALLMFCASADARCGRARGAYGSGTARMRIFHREGPGLLVHRERHVFRGRGACASCAQPAAPAEKLPVPQKK